MTSQWADLNAFRLRTGVSPALLPDVLVQAALASVQASVVAFLGFDPLPGTAVEYYDGAGTPAVALARKYVFAVSEVRLDPGGLYGQGAGTPFADATVLPPGAYALQLKGADRTGLLLRAGGAAWPGGWGRLPGRLAPTPVPLPGCLKVTYAYGINPDPDDTRVPPDVLEAVYAEAAARTAAWRTGLGAETSSTLDGHSLSITPMAFPGSPNGPRSPFYSPLAEMLLWKYRRVAIY